MLKLSLLVLSASFIAVDAHSDVLRFKRQSYELDMTLSEFRKTRHIPLDGEKPGKAVCSSDPGAAAAPYYVGAYQPDYIRKAGIIECRYFKRISGQEWEAGVRMMGDSYTTHFFFAPNKEKELRLFKIETFGPSGAFNAVADSLTSAYGVPEQRIEILKNKIGNTFENTILSWSSVDSKAFLHKFSYDLRMFEYEIISNWGEEILDESYKKQVKAKAADL